MTAGPHDDLPVTPRTSLLVRGRVLFALPGVKAPLLATTVGRIAIGMTGLALLLLVEERSGSYARAGLVAAVYAAALAVAVPLRARSADRRGQTAMLVTSGVVHPLALLSAVGAVLADLPLVVVLLSTAVAGAANPPLGAVMRALWASLAPDEATLLSAYTLESVLVEIAFVGGPLAVAGAVALAGPAAAVAIAAGLSATGSLLLAATPASRAWRPSVGRAPSLAGPLVSRPVRRLLLVLLGVGAAFGAVEVAVPAFAEASGSSAATGGVLLAVWSMGSVLGGLAYGIAHPQSPAHVQYGRLVALLAVTACLPALAPGPVVLGALLLLFGASIAPLFAVQSVLIDRLAPHGTLTEAFAWTTTAIFGGAAIGNAAAGWLVAGQGARSGLVLGGLSGLAALGVAAASRRALLPGPDHPVRAVRHTAPTV